MDIYRLHAADTVIDSIGTLRLALPMKANQRSAAAAAALSAFGALTDTASSRSERVLLVRKLKLRVDVRPNQDIQQLAHAAACAVDPAVQRALQQPARAADVLTFDSVAEYIVHFIEQYLNRRSLDVWYFRPLADCVAPDLATTLRNLALREPAAWPAVLRLLRQQGFVPLLLQRLPPDDYDLLYQEVPTRRLEVAEARPLFAAAVQLLQRANVDIANDDDAAAAAALTQYLQQRRAAPRSWSDRAALSQTVAEMLQWLVAHWRIATIDMPSARLALQAMPWLDAPPLLEVLQRVQAPAPATGASVTESALPTLAPRMNRTRAIRYLAAARQLSRAARGPAPSAANDAIAVVEQVVAFLQARPGLHEAAQIERLLADADMPGADARTQALITQLRAARALLNRTESRELITNLQALAQSSPAPCLATNAVGLLLLLRPLTDLRAEPAILASIADAAGIESNDPVRAIFRHGDNALVLDDVDTATHVEHAMQALQRTAALFGLDVERANSRQIGEFALDLACQQLVRWLHGFEKSSVEFVLRNLILRAGAIELPTDESVIAYWPGSGLDVLLDRVGYLDPIEAVPWWPGRGLRWRR